MDARLRIFVGGFCYCCRRDWPILAAFPAEKGGVWFEPPKTGQPLPFTGCTRASAAHWAVIVTIRARVDSVYVLGDAFALSTRAAGRAASSRASIRMRPAGVGRRAGPGHSDGPAAPRLVGTVAPGNSLIERSYTKNGVANCHFYD